jgi:hypothetical protein
MAPNNQNPNDSPRKDDDKGEGFSDVSSGRNPDDGVYDFVGGESGEDFALTDSFDNPPPQQEVDIYEYQEDPNDVVAPNFGETSGDRDIYDFQDDADDDLSFQEDFVREDQPDEYERLAAGDSEEMVAFTEQNTSKDVYEFNEGTPRSRQSEAFDRSKLTTDDPKSSPRIPGSGQYRLPPKRAFGEENPRIPGSGQYRLPPNRGGLDGPARLAGSASYKLPQRTTKRLGNTDSVNNLPRPSAGAGGLKRKVTRRMPRGVPGTGQYKLQIPAQEQQPSQDTRQPTPPATRPVGPPVGQRPARPGTPGQAGQAPRATRRVIKSGPIPRPSPPRPSPPRRSAAMPRPQQPTSGPHPRPGAPTGPQGPGPHRNPSSSIPRPRKVAPPQNASRGPQAKQTHRLPRSPMGQKAPQATNTRSFNPKPMARPTRSFDDEDPPFPT